GDITRSGLGVAAGELSALHRAEVFHLAAVYDLGAGEEANQLANVDGTAHAVEFAHRVEAARLHHMSSIAVAGAHFRGPFTEDMFDEGQKLDHPYYRTKVRRGEHRAEPGDGTLPDLPARHSDRLLRDRPGGEGRRSLLRLQVDPAPAGRAAGLGAAGRIRGRPVQSGAGGLRCSRCRLYRGPAGSRWPDL